ncbi:MAG: helix-turn-helix transcriptional regulator [Acidobacteria bacterium]|nr:helix-turn-helix transcriptional regulator [Acidobacteriota bacterium]
MKLLSRIEEVLLLAIWRLQDEAYGVPIREEVIRATGQHWHLGAIYGPLGRLYKNGYVFTVDGEPTPERGGRSKVFYRLTAKGREALRDLYRVNQELWTGISVVELEEEP